MQGHPEVKRLLNGALKDQLTVINQYFLHARLCKNWGLDKLNQQEYRYSIKAMKQADKLIERILFLEGLPNLQDLGRLQIGENPSELLSNDLAVSNAIRTALQTGVAQCEALADYVSRDLLTELLEEIEEQIDWLESQLWLIEQTGLENFLQSMI
ncbi:MAG: bacterioferritin [Cyanobacteria bacterium RI_101]|nr:bacterioferritin [Cyanobacteria bacterium RI_101]MEB3175717.1 bacterioferritin [Cyanobacteriota bacterium]